jgi:predicted lipoprotein with Yx(FWY)xxD motif
MKRPSVGAVTVMGAAALLAAGCGSGKKASGASAASATPSSTSAQAAPAAPGTSIAVKRAGKLGTVLAAGAKKMTVYLFEADKSAQSSCSGACASAWPPVTTAGKPVAGHGVLASDLGATKRADGTLQVTYNGHPLYYFVKDKDAGDAYGEGVNGFGASWYVVSPRGGKVDNT